MRIITLLIFFLLAIHGYGQNLVSNGNFTTPMAGWTTSGDFSFNTNFTQYNLDVGYGYTSDDPHDVGILYQAFFIPSNTTSATLDFYTFITTSETPSQAFDICTVDLYEIGGSATHQFVLLSNLDENSSYQNFNYSVPSSFFGKNVRLEFNFDNDGATPTRFRFDNVSLTATANSGSGNSDFYIYNESISVSTANAGDNISLSCRQADQGTTPNLVDVYLGYYLSNNTTLSTDDYFFPITNEKSTLGNGDVYDNESATVTIPGSTTSGQYYILWVADYDSQFSESDESNNVESEPIYINGTTNASDFYVYNENINVSSVNAGDNISLSCRQADQGTTPSLIDVYLGYYLSNDTVLSSNDYFFPITNEYSNLGDGDVYDNESATVTIPSTTTAGQYYILWVADYDNQFVESDETNNVESEPIYINTAISPDPDYYIFNESIDLTSVQAGSDVYVEYDQGHQGTFTTSADVNVGYYLSDDQTKSSDDHFFSSNIDFSSLTSSGDFDSENETLTIPAWTPQGQYYILIVSDYNNQFTESDETNNTAVLSLYVTASSTPVPTVNIVSPSQYICIPTTQSIQIEANITGVITGKEILYSQDGGNSWNSIWGLSTTNTSLSYSWSIPSFLLGPTYILFKVVVYYPGGSIEDIALFPCQIIPPTVPFELNPNGVSHLFWPFETPQYSWSQNELWIISKGHAINGHTGIDYYSLDYAKKTSFSSLISDLSQGTFNYPFNCNKTISAPFDFKLIRRVSSYSDDCDQNISSGGYANQIIIQSAQNENFAFRVAHLNYVNTNLQHGITYPKGTLLGEVGSTGNSSGPHAHCSLYKNIMMTHEHALSSTNSITLSLYDIFMSDFYYTLNLSYPSTELKQKYSAEFILNANNSYGSGGAGLESFTNNNQLYTINSNPFQDFFSIDFIKSETNYVSIKIYNVTGNLIYFQEEKIEQNSNKSINLSKHADGIYFIVVDDGKSHYYEKLIKSN